MENVSITTCLWFASHGIDAARFYISLIPDSRLLTAATGEDSPMIVDFTLAGVPYRILNGGPRYKLTPACSIAVTTHSEAETDRLWQALCADGGEESRCGWLIDRWGVSWQIVPQALFTMLGSADHEAAGRAQAAMLRMGKIEIAVLQAAFDAA